MRRVHGGAPPRGKAGLGSWLELRGPFEGSPIQLGLDHPWRSKADPFYRLPLDPIPLGFALNMLFYFAVFLAAMMSLSAARRAWRRRRGRCPDCNYDLSSSPGRCPECGRSIPACLGKPGMAH